MALAACSTPPSDIAPATCAPANVIVAASNYAMSSELVLLATDGGRTVYAGGTSFTGDPALASSQGRLFWINRTGEAYAGEVFELGPSCGNILAYWSANDSDSGTTNPQDIAVAPKTGNLWVARYDVPSILLKTSDGSSVLGTIDLSMVTGTYRNPRMSSIRIIDSKAYVALEMLDDNYDVTGPSYVARIDVASRGIDGMLELKGRNPFGLMVEYQNALYLADAGSTKITTETNAGIERIDLATFTSALITVESDIGASVDEVSIESATCGTAIVMGPGPDNVTSMISFNPTTGAIITPLSKQFLYTSTGLELSGMAWVDGGLNLVGDRTNVKGSGYPVHIVEASSTCELTERPTQLFSPESPPVALQAIP